MRGMGMFKSIAFAMQNNNTTKTKEEYEQESNDLRIRQSVAGILATHAVFPVERFKSNAFPMENLHIKNHKSLSRME